RLECRTVCRCTSTGPWPGISGRVATQSDSRSGSTSGSERLGAVTATHPRRATAMDFGLSDTAQDYLARLGEFMDQYVYPAEPVYEDQRRDLVSRGELHALPPIVEDLKKQARSRGLWNLFLPEVSGLSNLDYATLAEVTGRSP